MEPVCLLASVMLFTLLGVSIGIFSGLVPGIHPNFIAMSILAAQSVFFGFTAAVFYWMSPSASDIIIIVCALIVGVMIAHSFLDIIPSIYLGAPDDSTALSVLPGHRLVLSGRGDEAVRCAAIGAMGAVFLVLVLILPARLIIGQPVNAYEKLSPFIPFILLLIVALLMMSEHGKQSVPTLRFRPSDVSFPDNPDAGNRGENKHRGYNCVTVSEALKSCGTNKRITMTGTALRRWQGGWIIRDGTGIIHAAVIYKYGAERAENGMRIAPGMKVTVTGTVVNIAPPRSHLKQKCAALCVFLIAGFTGFMLIETPWIMVRNFYPIPQMMQNATVLFPMLTGFFGLSTLILSLSENSKIPPQSDSPCKTGLSRRRIFRGVLTGTAAGGLVAFYPGVTAAQGTIVAKLASGSGDEDSRDFKSQKEFIVSVSAVDTACEIFNILALFVIMRARSGGTIAISKISAPIMTPWSPVTNLPLLMVALLLSITAAAIVSYCATLVIGRRFAKSFARVNYRALTLGIIVFLFIMLFLFSGPIGLLIAAACTFIGFLPPLLGISRAHLMGCLLFPVILFYLGLDVCIMRFMGVG